MFEVTKNCNFFPRSLEFCKNWINLIWAVMMQKFMKYFYFSCNSFFGTFILVFPYHGDIVLLFRENCFLILSFSKSENTQNIPTIPTFHDLNSYFCPTFSKFWALLYPYFFTGGHLKACKLCMCFDIVEIRFRIANGKFRQFLTWLSASNTSIFSFPDDDLISRIFAKLGMCIDIVEICFVIANGLISSIFDSFLPMTHQYM